MHLSICTVIILVCVISTNAAGGYSGGYSAGSYGGGRYGGGGYGGGRGYGGYGGGASHGGGGRRTVIVPYGYPYPFPVRGGRGGRTRVIPATIIRQGGVEQRGGGGRFGGGGLGGLISLISKYMNINDFL